MPITPDRWLGIDHVQVAMPAGAEDTARRFYVGILGLTEVPKPAALAKRGGLWLRSGQVELHLGVENDFRPARKAHPALVLKDLAGAAEELAINGVAVLWDDNIPERRRCFVEDCFGNRLELVEAVT